MREYGDLKKTVAVLGPDSRDMDMLIRIIEEGHYRAAGYPDVPGLRSGLELHPCRAVILDVDNVHLDNRTIRELTVSFPSVAFLCVSRYSFHPELREAISKHLFACLKKPVDPDELHYFLKCLFQDHGEPRSPAGREA